ncbi:apolipoprotein L3-like isoform X2 [Heptranchias perlo]|uniref:apolipoprotein L3-like isoform X2 n=1 Tax=Heptranchias perlo TaxID=212740 RepID=UPI00355A5506
MEELQNPGKELNTEDFWDQLESELEERTKDVEHFANEFPQWENRMTGHINELQKIANSIDQYHKGAKIANVTGSSAGAVGGILTLGRIIAAPFTAGTSLVLTAVGACISGAGAVTNFTADISEYVNRSKKQKRVDEIMKQYKSDRKEMSERLKDTCNALQFLSQCMDAEMVECDYSEEEQEYSQGISKARKVFNKYRKKYLSEVKAGLQANSISVTTFNVTASLLAKQVLRKTPGLKELAKKLTALSHDVRNTKYAVEAGSVKRLLAVSGVMAVFFVAWDIYSITKDSIELSKGSKTEVAEKIRNEAQRMDDELKVYEDIYQFLKKSLR